MIEFEGFQTIWTKLSFGLYPASSVWISHVAEKVKSNSVVYQISINEQQFRKQDRQQLSNNKQIKRNKDDLFCICRGLQWAAKNPLEKYRISNSMTSLIWQPSPLSRAINIYAPDPKSVSSEKAPEEQVMFLLCFNIGIH